MNNFAQKHKALIVILTVIIGIYTNTLFHDYALDDTLVITRNEFTKQGLQGIPDILANDGFVGFFGHNNQLVAGGRYRPMAQIFFAFEYELFGLNPFIGHLMNVLCYALTCWMVFVILKRLFKVEVQRPEPVQMEKTNYYFTLPFIATLLFAVHPLHTEVVANIKGRDEIFSLLGALGALYFSLKYVENPKKSTLIWICLTFLFGLFSKENALTFLAVIPLTIYLFTGAYKPRSCTLVMAALGITSIIFLYARYNALGYWIGNTRSDEILNNPFLYATSTQRLATVLYTWLIYFKLLFIPYPLTHDYYPFQIPILGFTDFRVWISLIIVGFLVYYAIKNFKKSRIVSYGILFFIITFSMASNLVLNVGTFMNERFVYTPLLGFTIVIGYLFTNKLIPFFKTKRLKFWLLGALVLIIFHALGLSTLKRNRVWKNDLTLFTTDVKTSINSAKVNVSAGGQLTEYAETLTDDLEKQNVLNQAYQYLQKGIRLHPQNHQAWFLLGNCCREIGRYDEAYTAYSNALLIKPAMKEAQNNILYTAQKTKGKEHYDIAKKFYSLAVPYYPEPVYQCELAECHIRIGHIDSAEWILNQVLVSEPDNIMALNKKAEIAGMFKNDLPTALKTLQKAYKSDSSALTTNENLGIVYGMMRDCERSIFHLKKALAKDTTNPRILENLQQSYAICKQKR